jgi:hypothetical protein
MVVLVECLLLILVAVYIAAPFLERGRYPQSSLTPKQLEQLGEELEQEILALRQHPEQDASS